MMNGYYKQANKDEIVLIYSPKEGLTSSDLSSLVMQTLQLQSIGYCHEKLNNTYEWIRFVK